MRMHGCLGNIRKMHCLKARGVVWSIMACWWPFLPCYNQYQDLVL